MPLLIYMTVILLMRGCVSSLLQYGYDEEEIGCLYEYLMWHVSIVGTHRASYSGSTIKKKYGSKHKYSCLVILVKDRDEIEV